MRDYKTEFIKCLDSIDYGKRRFAVFQDFLEISSISFENAVQMDNDRDEKKTLKDELKEIEQKTNNILG